MKKALLIIAVLVVGVVAFYGTHVYLSHQRVKAALAADPEYQALVRERAN